MSDKLDRFTKYARRALTLSQEEALRLNHSYIGPEHLLLGLVREENGMVLTVLRELGVEPGQIIHTVERTAGHSQTPPTHKPTLTETSKRVIELSVDEARLMGHHYIGTEHLLLGLVRQGESLAVKVLQAVGLDLDKVRTQMARAILLKQAQGKAEARGSLLEAVDPSSPPIPLGPLRHDLTEAAQEGKLDPLIGRQEELERIIQILGRRTKNNPILVGEPGVGKRAIVRGLAQRMVNGEVSLSLLNRRLLVLDAGNFVVSIIYRELVEQRLHKVLAEGASSRSILFIDNVHRIVTAAGTDVDIANVFKLALNRGELQIIGATTPSQYAKHISADVAREWYVQPVEIKEASLEETIAILKGVKFRYEDHHQLSITDEALNVAAHLAARYATDGFLPEKAIDLLDESSSYARMHNAANENSLREALLELKEVKKKKQEAVEEQRFDDAIDLRYREVELEAKIAALREHGSTAINQPKLTLEEIAQVVSLRTGVPRDRLIAEERNRLQGNS
ncbi:MAG: AAA family ATPase [Caldilineaceae bacterium]|nr:AAA family ATPase [Caldilineaceae bacterium]